VAVALLTLAALAASPAATAHGGGGAAIGYASTIDTIRPEAPGVTLEVLDGDDRLRLTYGGSAEVVVLGYEGEPYLRITSGAVFQNVRSAATYLNRDRFGEADLPAIVDPEAAPRWERIEDQPRVEWHDHRIHWMSTNPPPDAREDPDSPHQILTWEVPLVVGGSDVIVSGTLDYEPPDKFAFSPILLVPFVVLVLVGSAAWWLRSRNERRKGAATGAPGGPGTAR
jgi:hypothetical protein